MFGWEQSNFESYFTFINTNNTSKGSKMKYLKFIIVFSKLNYVNKRNEV